MKKLITFVVLAVAAFMGMQAQQLRWGLEAEGLLSRPFYGEFSAKFGFGVGARAEYSFKDAESGWLLTAALGLTSRPMSIKGYGNTDISEQPGEIYKYESEIKATPYYLTLPIQFGYRLGIGNGCSLQLTTGPSVGLGLFGNLKGKMTFPATGQTEYGTGHCFSGEDSLYRRFYIGWGVSAGVNFCEHWQVGFRYNVQFNSMTAEGFEEYYNQCFGISVGYMF